MMKKMLLSVITGSMILAGSTCSATVPADQLVLGESSMAPPSVPWKAPMEPPQVGTGNEAVW